MKFSIVMTTYDRPQFLYFTLKSLRRQRLGHLDHELLILEDGTDPDGKTIKVALRSDAAQGLNIRYIRTGCRTNERWRPMGFAANIGIKQARGEIIVLTNSDVYHLGATVRPVIRNAERDPYALSTLNQVYDDDGRLITSLLGGIHSERGLARVMDAIRRSDLPGVYPANPDVPFFLAVRRDLLLQVGGYDEDFIGPASEDCDLLDRLKALGCHYIYAPPGAEAVHLYHGRRTIKELKADPGFAHNIRLRQERKDQLVRNQGREWGELIDPDVSQDGAPIHLVIWVTSRCNLDCPLCNQKTIRRLHPDYEMTLDELQYILSSSQARGIRYSTIELTGGEPTLWSHFSEGIRLICESGMARHVTFITNGRDPEGTTEIANRYGLHYVVSAHQCSKANAEVHRRQGVGVIWNKAPHYPPPEKPILRVLPAECSQRQDGHGRVVRQLYYVQGRVWYCCMAYSASRLVGDLPLYSCPFDDDFGAYFYTRRYDLPICRVCLCNKNVWDHQSMVKPAEGIVTP